MVKKEKSIIKIRNEKKIMSEFKKGRSVNDI